ncbi:MAG: ImmA/IrrE family metallo-endopeptidase [Candidatus Aenigmarchaeota archaeon]|nr:ImmA/IrrE family metallo-endopeptidase [Candidatus Aenigmarchaeota archaeon]
MPRKSIKIDVKPDVFKWLRVSAGWNIEEVSKRIKTSPETVKAFETGDKTPTFRQLKELSRSFRRPVAAFLLPEPKKEKGKPKDYRFIPGRSGIFDKKTILVLREARSLQEAGKDLSSNIEYETKAKVEKVGLSADPEKIAKKYREVFGLTEEKQKRFKRTYDLFNYLRDILEDMNILVFQFSMPVEDARGFVLSDESPAVIVVNTMDTIEARLFSLMHEFAHILLGQSVIDFPDISSSVRNSVEKWCNEFAASVLLPKEIARVLFEANRGNLIERTRLNYLSRKYKVSKAMLLFNMMKMGYITKTEYENKLSIYHPKEAEAKKKGGKAGGGIPADKRCISKVGTKFVSLVANNYDHGYITYTDALNYLSIKSKNFDKVLAKAMK